MSEDLLRRQGEARIDIYAHMRELRELVESADIDSDPGFRKAIRLNTAAHRLSVAVKNYGRLLP